MAQLVSLCLTNTGTTTLSNIDIYSDYLGGWTLIQSGVQVSAMTGNNCPYVLIVPDGTNNIRLIDESSRCNVILNLQSGEFCSTCNLNLSSFSTSATTISAGNLTGSCQTSITDYQINWYGPNSNTNLAFQSGGGTLFPYDILHPFTNAPALGGTYRPVINKVRLSGITFSSTGGTGEVQANIDCLSGVTVTDCDCGNGNISGDYSHQVVFTSSSNLKPARGLTQRFILSSNTEYFPISFSGLSVFDTLKITFSGANYSVPIILENMTVGDDSTNNVTPTVIPKTLDYTFYKKVLCLTGLTKTNGDYLLLEVTPNSTNNNTSWQIQSKCLGNTFDCNNCFENYKNQSVKIIGSSVTGLTGTCDTIVIRFRLSGCSLGEISNSDVYKYLIQTSSTSIIDPSFNRSTNGLYHSGSSCILNTFVAPNQNVNCVATGGTINLVKSYSPVTGGTYFMSFTNFIDFTAFNNSLNSMKTLSGSSDPSNNNYYRWTVLGWLVPSTLPTNGCGDSYTTTNYFLHPATFTATTATTMTGYTIEVIQPIITAQTLFTSCQLACQANLAGVCNNINGSSQAASPSLSTTIGLRLVNPFSQYVLNVGPTINSATANTFSYNVTYYRYGNLIYPYSGTSTFIPSLSAITCQSINNIQNTLLNNTISNANLGSFNFRITNPLDVRDFDIWATPINNYVYSGFPGSAQYELAYRFSGGSVTFTNPNYII